MKNIFYLLLFFQSLMVAQVKSSYTSVEKQMRLIPEQQTKSVHDIATYIQARFQGVE